MNVTNSLSCLLVQNNMKLRISCTKIDVVAIFHLNLIYICNATILVLPPSCLSLFLLLVHIIVGLNDFTFAGKFIHELNV